MLLFFFGIVPLPAPLANKFVQTWTAKDVTEVEERRLQAKALRILQEDDATCAMDAHTHSVLCGAGEDAVLLTLADGEARREAGLSLFRWYGDRLWR